MDTVISVLRPRFLGVGSRNPSKPFVNHFRRAKPKHPLIL